MYWFTASSARFIIGENVAPGGVPASGLTMFRHRSASTPPATLNLQLANSDLPWACSTTLPDLGATEVTVGIGQIALRPLISFDSRSATSARDPGCDSARRRRCVFRLASPESLPLPTFLTSSGSYVSRTLTALSHAVATHRILIFRAFPAHGSLESVSRSVPS